MWVHFPPETLVCCKMEIKLLPVQNGNNKTCPMGKLNICKEFQALPKYVSALPIIYYYGCLKSRNFVGRASSLQSRCERNWTSSYRTGSSEAFWL